jgi:hypothetical protein
MNGAEQASFIQIGSASLFKERPSSQAILANMVTLNSCGKRPAANRAEGRSDLNEA